MELEERKITVSQKSFWKEEETKNWDAGQTDKS